MSAHQNINDFSTILKNIRPITPKPKLNPNDTTYVFPKSTITQCDFCKSHHHYYQNFTCYKCGFTKGEGVEKFQQLYDKLTDKQKSFIKTVEHKSKHIKPDRFRLSSKRVFATFPGHIDKQMYTQFILNKVPDSTVFIAHETADESDPYPHSHCIISFPKRVDWSGSHCLCFVGKHQCIQNQSLPKGQRTHCNIKLPSSNKHWANMHKYICKEDKSNEQELMKLYYQLSGFTTSIWDHDTIHSALSDPDIKSNEVIPAIHAWQHKPLTFNQFEVIPFQDLSSWQQWLFSNILKLFNIKLEDHREVGWIVDFDGNKGKTKAVRYAFTTLNQIRYDFLTLKSLAGQKAIATSVETARNQGWTGKAVLVDLVRACQKNDIYAPIESIVDGMFTSQKYHNNNTILPRGCIIYVLANFMPKFNDTLSIDRWRVYDITTCNWDDLPYTFHVLEWLKLKDQLLLNPSFIIPIRNKYDERNKLLAMSYSQLTKKQLREAIHHEVDMYALQILRNKYGRLKWTFDPRIIPKEYTKIIDIPPSITNLSQPTIIQATPVEYTSPQIIQATSTNHY